MLRKGDPVSERSVKPEQFGQFLIEVFDEWVRHDVGRIFVRPSKPPCGTGWACPPACASSSDCGHGLALEHNGDLYYLRSFCGSEVLARQYPGTGACSELVGSERSNAPSVAAKLRRPAQVLPGMRRCWFACQGECPKNRFREGPPKGEPGLNYLCGGYKAFFRRVNRPLKIMAQLMSQEQPAARVMEVLGPGGRTAGLRSGAGRRRRILCPCGSGLKYKKCQTGSEQRSSMWDNPE